MVAFAQTGSARAASSAAGETFPGQRGNQPLETADQESFAPSNLCRRSGCDRFVTSRNISQNGPSLTECSCFGNNRDPIVLHNEGTEAVNESLRCV